MTRKTKWLIIITIVIAILLLWRMKAFAPASILSAILLITGIIERVMHIQALRRVAKQTSTPPAASQAMSYEEALELLELGENPTPKEVKEAYHKLMKRNHPDQGGSKYLATKINAAKTIVLNELKRRGNT